MATSLKNLSEFSGKNMLDMSYRKFAILVSEWNEVITESLFSGTFETLIKNGVPKENISRCDVPGSYELT
ncbi:MAG: 6,7-dimethyl-8-ribityllumazine synthase [Bacteroidetes bacterium]|nr:6,7-dimethyl-8-ribityllumazine synthase [Bacteroidota bacterium]